MLHCSLRVMVLQPGVCGSRIDSPTWFLPHSLQRVAACIVFSLTSSYFV